MGPLSPNADRLITIDPGIRVLGLSEHGLHTVSPPQAPIWRMTRATLIRNPIKKGNDIAAVRAIVEEALKWVGSRVGVWDVGVEVPQIYNAASQKGDQNDLIPLAMIVGMFAGRAGLTGARLHQFKPNEWKGSIAADTCTRRIWNTLDVAEQDLIHREEIPASLLHNTLDAVGIGLKLTGRFEPKRVYPL